MHLITKRFEELTTQELYEILSSRADIFVTEQNIHYNDIDGKDYKSYHFFFKQNNKIIAYLRAFYENESKERLKIGRVLTRMHGSGIGKELLTKSITYIKENIDCKIICLDAQKHAVGFYQKFNFFTTSDEFLEEGIPHIKMELEIK